jgi:hypothetical protein
LFCAETHPYRAGDSIKEIFLGARQARYSVELILEIYATDWTS